MTSGTAHRDDWQGRRTVLSHWGLVGGELGRDGQKPLEGLARVGRQGGMSHLQICARRVQSMGSDFAPLCCGAGGWPGSGQAESIRAWVSIAAEKGLFYLQSWHLPPRAFPTSVQEKTLLRRTEGGSFTDSHHPLLWSPFPANNGINSKGAPWGRQLGLRAVPVRRQDSWGQGP